jgi:malonate transporter MadL subunit
MTMSGVALLAICTLLGQLLGVKANVGGVGVAMIVLIAARLWLERHGRMSRPALQGIAFRGALYIPIVVAMAAQQDVVAAVRGGPVVLIAGAGSPLLHITMAREGYDEGSYSAFGARRPIGCWREDFRAPVGVRKSRVSKKLA